MHRQTQPSRRPCRLQPTASAGQSSAHHSRKPGLISPSLPAGVLPHQIPLELVSPALTTEGMQHRAPLQQQTRTPRGQSRMPCQRKQMAHNRGPMKRLPARRRLGPHQGAIRRRAARGLPSLAWGAPSCQPGRLGPPEVVLCGHHLPPSLLPPAPQRSEPEQQRRMLLTQTGMPARRHRRLKVILLSDSSIGSMLLTCNPSHLPAPAATGHRSMLASPDGETCARRDMSCAVQAVKCDGLLRGGGARLTEHPHDS